MSMQYGYQRGLLLGLVALTTMFFGPALRSACAQTESLADWSTKEYPKLNKQNVKFLGLGSAMHDGNWQDPADEQLFADYYEKGVFPQITHYELRGTKDDVIGTLRSDFKRLEKFRSGPVFTKLVDITLEYMPKIALDPRWHPAARENAVLALGEVKSPKTVGVLLNLIRDPKLHPMFKAAAIADLIHLADQGVLDNPTVADPVVTLMVAAARARPDKPVTDEIRWRRGLAADALGAIKSTGSAGEVPSVLLAMVADKDLLVIQRGKAARALGRLDYTNSPPDQAAFAKAFAAFGSDALVDTLPADPRRTRAVARDILAGLEPLTKLDPVPKAVKSMQEAMSKLQAAAAKAPVTLETEADRAKQDDFKDAIANAKAVFDGLLGKEPSRGGEKRPETKPETK